MTSMTTSNSNLRSLEAGSKEASILLELLQGGSGQSFANDNEGWDESTPVCDWKGITCDSSGNLESVQVTNEGLQGTLPQSFGDLSTLVHLYLSSNQFTGSIPSNIKSLSKLKTLDVSFNNLGGQIPFPLSSAMESFHVGHNKLSGNLPTSFAAGTSNLKIFDVKYNRLIGTLPDSNKGLAVIETLDLSNNKFQGMIPTTINELTSLRALYLSNNLLEGTIPHQLGDSQLSLREIFLHGNLLTGTLPASLADLRGLEVLFIDDNELTGTVPPKLCAMDLNEIFFHSGDGDTQDVDSSYTEMYGASRRRRSMEKKSAQRQPSRHRMERDLDPNSERDGCTSIACPAGYKSKGDNNKDGVFPCELCEEESLNPYIGSNRCFDINQDHVIDSLYDATNGPSWTGATNWGDSGVATCDKEGITCNDNSQITNIVLQSKGLSGTLPVGLGFLDRLVEFDVSNNAIGGFLPADLRFAPLKMLDVGDNQLTGYVPIGLCQKSGVNGNGEDGLYTCDIISCRSGYHSSNGRADPGTEGELCRLCTSDTSPFLGITDCEDAAASSLTPFGMVGEIAITIFGLTMICVVIFIMMRSKISSSYIADRAYFTHGPGKDELDEAQAVHDDSSASNADSDDELDPLGGIDGLTNDRGVPKLEVKVKDEWNGGKEKSHKEVWLDVPKIA
mmetsp:Transcript_15801/g.26486  ORF Transcript_15801/g.26486 Transcript_15801/m.26486 type:complete len:674 (-) Transcript_15801:90-2111(-)|eukprot:CAMPEP_0119003758 /NCGR_PEP_ID=MMETSP1176-20130426/748_1 /TAXON_ID=265551 /ORGANISM="Synedropsis recta cf, Strain CCMP1620" /LENGTH=673 /DNA_ID=CAMNT_0006955383 /DNA_START=34 /DNA_END=2058 /DNA_ORIENTATION=+